MFSSLAGLHISPLNPTDVGARRLDDAFTVAAVPSPRDALFRPYGIVPLHGLVGCQISDSKFTLKHAAIWAYPHAHGPLSFLPLSIGPNLVFSRGRVQTGDEFIRRVHKLIIRFR